MNSLAQSLAFSQPRGSGQSPISPLAMQLSRSPTTHWAELLGKLAMVGVDNWGRSERTKDQADSIAGLLTPGASKQWGEVRDAAGMAPTAGGGQQRNQLAEMLAGSPELMPFFQSAALEKQFPDIFGEAPELVEAYDEASGTFKLMPAKEGLTTKPAKETAAGQWQRAEDGTYFRTNPNVPNGIEFYGTQPGPDPLYNVGGPAAVSAAPMEAISGLETGGSPNAAEMTSPVGALGQFQIMPKTALGIAREKGDAYAVQLAETDPLGFERYIRDPQVNREYGEYYFNQMRQKYGSDVLAAAAYNAGPGRVDQALNAVGGQVTQQNFPQFLAQLPKETQEYLIGNDKRPGFIQRTAGGARAASASGAPPFPGNPEKLSDKENQANAIWLRDTLSTLGRDPTPEQAAYIETFLPDEDTPPEFERMIARYNELDAIYANNPDEMTAAQRNERKALRKKLNLGGTYTGNESQARYLVGAQALDTAAAQLDQLLAEGYMPTGLSQFLQGLRGEGNALLAAAANAELSPQDQVFFQLVYQISDGANRPVSGAAINAEDLRNAFFQYIPQAGDSPEAIKRKRDALYARSNSFYGAAGFAPEERDEARAQAQGIEAPPLPTAAQPNGAGQTGGAPNWRFVE